RCAQVCPAGTTCVNGTCSCGGALISCSGMCVNPTTDPSNCGGCSMLCSSNHMLTITCNGTCNGTCNTGYSDCNNDKRLDGCEVATGSNVNNCGSCGKVCSTNNLTPNCTNGVCGGTCFPGYTNCNGNISDGCEIHTDADINNCGGCGVAYVCSSFNVQTRS